MLVIPFLDLIDEEEDKEFFAHLYVKYRKLLLQVAYHKFNDYQYAEDAVIEAYEYVAEHFDKIKDRTEIEAKTYLVYITRSRANYYREKMGKDLSIEEIEDVVIDEQVEDEFFEKYDSDALYKALEKIDEKFSLPLVFKYMYNLNSKEIGDLVGSHDVTVRRRMLYGKQKLRKLLERELKDNE